MPIYVKPEWHHAVKKEGRETKEGMIGIAESEQTVAIVEVNAETDFVVKNDRFKEFLENIAEEVAKTNPASLDAFLQQKYSKEPGIDYRSISSNGCPNHWRKYPNQTYSNY